MKEAKKKKFSKIYTKQILIISCIFINIIFLASVFGRYVSNNVRGFFGRTKEFYFYSDKLDTNNPNYQIESWSGVDDYTITINMHSYENNLLETEYDIEYDISYTASDNIICQLSKTQGMISADTNTDYFNLTITPNAILETGDKVFVEITAHASSPYEKTIKGKFTLVVGQEKLSYEIIDSVNSPYCELNITNTLSYYIVSQAFDTYLSGDKITRDTYLNLTDTNKAKCYSSIVTLTFNPNDVLIDNTNNAYVNAISTTQTQKNNYTYINGMTFKVDALSSQRIRFYKTDVSKDYTYPKNNNTPIITLTNI